MAGPITWKNVNAPSFGDSARILDQGGQSIGRGLDTLRNLAQGIGQTQADNWNTQRTQNTDEVLAQIQGLRDLQGYDALQSQITPDYLKQRFGQQVDASRILSALGSRDDQLRQEYLDGVQYQNTLRDQQESPTIRRFNELVSANQFDSARQFLEESDLHDKSPLYNALRSARRNEQEYQENRTQILQTRAAQRQLQQLLNAEGLDELAVRTRFQDWARENGIAGNVISSILDRIPGEYQDARGLTNEQQQALAASVSAINTQRDNQIETARRELATFERRHPVDPIFSFTDENRVSEGDAWSAITQQHTGSSISVSPWVVAANPLLGAAAKLTFESTKSDTTGDDLNRRLQSDVIPYIRDALNLRDDQEIPGNVIEEAYARPGVVRENGNVNLVQLQKNILDTYRQYTTSQENDTLVEEQRARTESLIRSLEARAAQASSAEKARLQAQADKIRSTLRETLNPEGR